MSTGTVAGIAVGVIVLLLLAALVLAVVAVLLYGYRHPDSGIGLKMIEVGLVLHSPRIRMEVVQCNNYANGS